MPGLGREFGYARRALAKTPLFTAATVLTLTLAVGSNTAVFSVLDPLLWRDLSVQNPSSLIALDAHGKLGSVHIWELPSYRFFAENQSVLSGAVAFTPREEIDTGFRAQRFSALQTKVSPNYFSLLGIDCRLDGQPAAIVSHDLWKRQLLSDPHIIGQTLTISGTPFVIAGITPPAFRGLVVGEPADIYTLLDTSSGSADWVEIVARLKPRVSMEQARSALTFPFLEARRSSSVPLVERQELMQVLDVIPAERGVSDIRSRYSTPLRILLAIAAFVLLVACANVGHLFLTRGIDRSSELAIKSALGAGRWQLIRELLVANTILAATGCLCGLAAGTLLSSRLLSALDTERLGLVLPTGLTYQVWIFAGAVLVFVVLVCGLLPALSLVRHSPGSRLRASTPRATYHRSASRLSRLFVTTQVASCLVLLISSGLLLKSVYRLETSRVGFDREKVLTVSLEASESTSAAEVRATYIRFMQSARTIPGVASASTSLFSPLSGQQFGINVAEANALPEKSRSAFLNSVSPGYFQTLGVPLLEGRDFRPSDATGSSPEVIINQQMALDLFAGRSALGRQIRFVEGRRAPMTVAGVVGNSKYSSLREVTPDFLYLNQLAHAPSRLKCVLNIRAFRDANRLISVPLEKMLRRIDPSVRITRVATLSEQIDESIKRERGVTVLCSIFGLIALGLAFIGLYAIFASAVTRRTGEMGIRIALGAQRSQLIALLAQEITWIVVAGVTIGIAAGLLATQALKSLLFGVSTADPFAIVSSCALVFGICVVGAIPPACRMLFQIDPAEALRQI